MRSIDCCEFLTGSSSHFHDPKAPIFTFLARVLDFCPVTGNSQNPACTFLRGLLKLREIAANSLSDGIWLQG
ncbi:MAG: hypothetical protein A2W25_03840 [candidate division Zixibacteria bacterium RBG_16_53_22]|nr:MAG: hypothetical protein A2W25_03840 [candidate division Zixibacteria bacterium RBG_16_53_22]